MVEKSCAWVLGIQWRIKEKKQKREARKTWWRLRADESAHEGSVHTPTWCHGEPSSRVL
jgi:hypothetical protein